MVYSYNLVLGNLSERHCLSNRRKLFSIAAAESASFSQLLRYSLISIFSKYHFKTSTLFLLSLSSHVHTTLNCIAVILVSYFEK